MILNSIDTQFKLADNGDISWQRDLTNPMPGEVVATIKKGDHVLNPSCSLVASDATKDEDQAALVTFIQAWLGRNVQSVLEPLFKLLDDDIAEGAPRDIAKKLHDALGILPREDLEHFISQMDEEKRATLRSKKIRFGPLLVFLPELNKPATVKLRALLLSLYQDKDLPAEAPADGIVSFSVADKEIDNDYYRSIGYPIYGPRSIRVDMLDRVVCAVYDAAKEGKFQAQHQMAEWLGCNIADLYAVLEAMGHKKIYDPADESEKESENKEAQENAKPLEAEAKADASADKVEDKRVQEANPEEAKPAPQVKPELATFRLKKGKAISQSSASSTAAPSNKTKKFDKNKFSSKSKSKKEKPKKPQGQRVYKAEAESNPDDNPFAILQQLKK